MPVIQADGAEGTWLRMQSLIDYTHLDLGQGLGSHPVTLISILAISQLSQDWKNHFGEAVQSQGLGMGDGALWRIGVHFFRVTALSFVPTPPTV